MKRPLAALLVIALAGSPVVASAGYPGAASPADLAALKHAKADYRTFFGVDDPRYDTGQEVTRRIGMCDALKAAILGAHASGELTTNDPTAGFGGSFQHSVAAMFGVTDLGRLLRDQGPPEELIPDGNYYAKFTELREKMLRYEIERSPGKLEPADVMRLALEVSDGNYVTATLTAANLLKNVAYGGRLEAKQGLLYDDRHEAAVAVKLVSLRGNPGYSDKMGPWYHLFSILFLGSITSRSEAESEAAAEEFSRYLLHEKLGFTNYSAPDPEKAAWDRCAEDVMIAVHPVLYHAAAPPKTLAGSWHLSSGCSYGGGDVKNSMHALAGPVALKLGSEGEYTGRFGEGGAMGGFVESGSLHGGMVTLTLHPSWYDDDPTGENWNDAAGWVSRLTLDGHLDDTGRSISGSVTHNSPKPDCDFKMTR
jgi:hypothetical protein